MSGEITITPGYSWDCIDPEKIDCVKLDDTANPTARVNEGAINTRELADRSVTSEKLSEDIIAQINADATIANGSVTTQKLADGAVTLAKISPSLINIIWPIDGLIFTEDDSDTYPADKGIPGTWVRVGKRRAIYGYDPTSTEHDAIGNSDTEPTSTWGATNTRTLAVANLPTGNIIATTAGGGAHTHQLEAYGIGGGNLGAFQGGAADRIPVSDHSTASGGGAHTHTGSITGAADQAFDIRGQGYIVAIWKRTA